jgi:hypothetical protein
MHKSDQRLLARIKIIGIHTMKSKKNTIPLELREQLSKDPEYDYCCITGKRGTPDDPIEWHHNLKFAGTNVQERFAILPILQSIHFKADNIEVRETLDRAMLYRDTEQKLFNPLGYSKARNWKQRSIYLTEKLGPYYPPHPEPKRAGVAVVSKKEGLELSKQEWAIVFKVKDQLARLHPDVTLSTRDVLNHMILSFSE